MFALLLILLVLDDGLTDLSICSVGYISYIQQCRILPRKKKFSDGPMREFCNKTEGQLPVLVGYSLLIYIITARMKSRYTSALEP